jgi:hypothetical protein
MRSTLRTVLEDDNETSDDNRNTLSRVFFCLFCCSQIDNVNKMSKMTCGHWCCVECKHKALSQFGLNQKCLKCQEEEENLLLRQKQNQKHSSSLIIESLMNCQCQLCGCRVDERNIFKISKCNHVDHHYWCCRDCKEEDNEKNKCFFCLNYDNETTSTVHLDYRKVEEYSCGICGRSEKELNDLKEPWVILAQCAHSFCESCIKATITLNRNKKRDMNLSPLWSCTLCKLNQDNRNEKINKEIFI